MIDIAISAGGFTLYELCSMSTPTIGISLWDNQKNNVDCLAEKGALIPLYYSSKYFDSELETELRRLIENLELRKKMFEDKDDEQSKKELNRLEQKYTLGNVNFDSVIIIDFGNSLKSVLTSFAFTDVGEDKVLFATLNQWFDESIFYENTIKDLYYPSVNYKEFKKYNEKYFKKFNVYPSEITILAYDALGLIYYAWKKNGKISSVNDFLFKDKIKGKIGTFSFKNGKVIQELDIYKTDNKKFIKF